MNTAAQPARGGVVVPFVLIALIWGSTWFVIRDQISAVPPGWTVTWRFALASLGMVVLAAVRRESLGLPPGGQRVALIVGLTQFCLNYEFVYEAERYLTSGIVAVFYALLLVPNALLSALFLKTRLTGRFLAGSAVAIAGIALLLAHEMRMAPAEARVGLGIALCLGGLIAASVANVVQAGEAARRCAPVPLMAWSMIWGTLIDAAYALAVDGPPVFDPRPAYWAGVAYLAIVGSVITFPLYFRLIRDMGAGGAAYNGVVTPVVAMGLSSLFEGYRWSVLSIAGSVLAMAGLLIALSARGKHRG